MVARRGEGSVRDALSILDQVIAFSGRTLGPADVATVLGLSETNFFARLMGLIADGDHAGILAALDEAASAGRDFKMLFRDLLNFVRNLLLIAGGANEAALSASPEDLAVIRSAAERFSYTELLRVANLLLRDDETVNRAEHQRLAVEIALLKAATFPKLREVESMLAAGGEKFGARVSSPAPSSPETRSTRPPAKSAGEDTRAPKATDDPQAFVDHLRKTRPLFAGYLAGARSIRKETNRLVFVFDDPHLAQPLLDARESLEQAAADVYGGPTSVLIETASQEPQRGRRADDQSSLGDDPVLKAFAKHLGGEVVKEKR
jgi:DNA polymerase-3 subunit gamma/tau